MELSRNRHYSRQLRGFQHSLSAAPQQIQWIITSTAGARVCVRFHRNVCYSEKRISRPSVAWKAMKPYSSGVTFSCCLTSAWQLCVHECAWVFLASMAYGGACSMHMYIFNVCTHVFCVCFICMYVFNCVLLALCVGGRAQGLFLKEWCWSSGHCSACHWHGSSLNSRVTLLTHQSGERGNV